MKTKPEFEPTDEQRELVAVLSSCGIPQATICRFVTWKGIADNSGKTISEPTLRKAFREELDEAGQVAHAKLIRTAFHMATVDKIPSLVIFLLKTRLGWKEPAQDVNLHQTYGQLLDEARKAGKPDLKVVGGTGQ